MDSKEVIRSLAICTPSLLGGKQVIPPLRKAPCVFHIPGSLVLYGLKKLCVLNTWEHKVDHQ